MATIVNNRVAGTRITVWDYQVRAAVQYIKDNEPYVMEVHRKIEERNARGHPPEVQAKVDAAHARFTEYVKRFREAQDHEANRARDSGRQ